MGHSHNREHLNGAPCKGFMATVIGIGMIREEIRSGGAGPPAPEPRSRLHRPRDRLLSTETPPLQHYVRFAAKEAVFKALALD
jgi:hypothetical protein